MNCRMLLARAVFCGLGMVGYAYGGVLNPGFETGDFTNWTQFGDTGYQLVTGADCGHGATTSCTPHTGSFAAFLGNPSLGGISQSLATVPNSTYNVDFWLRVDVDSRGYLNTEYRVWWDSTILADVVDAPIAPWQHLFFTTTAGGTTSVLKFEFRNSPDWFGLDDVNVTAGAAPEPVSLILAGTSLIALAGLSRLMRRNRR